MFYYVLARVYHFMAFSRSKMSPRIFANPREFFKIRVNSRRLADKTDGRQDFEKTMLSFLRD
jgi:hypothetical protein